MADYKVGLDYFELNCQLEEKVRLIQAEYGLKGFAVVVKLYQKIYGEFGYYCEWSEDSLLLFMSENGIPSDSKNLIQEIVSACVRRDIFSEKLFKEFGILTSSGVQKRYLKATSRREKVSMKKEYLLLSAGKINSNVDIIGENVDIIGENVDIIGQSRVEKSRVEKSRVEKSNNSPLSPSQGEWGEKPKRSRFVPPILREVMEYCQERGNGIDAQAFIDFYESKGWFIGKNKMKDWKAAVRTWERNRNKNASESKQDQFQSLMAQIRRDEENARRGS